MPKRISSKKKKKEPSAMELKLLELENQLMQKGVQVRYERLEAAGLKLKGGICRVKGESHLFVDKREPLAEKIRILKDYLAKSFLEVAPAPGKDNISETS